MKKVISLIVLLIVFLAGCSTSNKDLNEHEHIYKSTFEYNNNYHYYICTCGEKKNIEEHIYEEGVEVMKETIFNNGLKRYTCICGSIKEEVIDEIKFETDTLKKTIFLITTSVGENVSNEVGISWHSMEQGSYLVYQEEGATEVTKVFPKEEYWSIEESYISDAYQNKRYVCRVDLTNLKANTKYIYKIICGDVSSTVLSFKTASSLSKYCFLSFVDFQYSQNKTTLNLVRTFINKNPDASLITCSGDITDEGYLEKSHRYLFDSNVFVNSILAFGVGDHEYWGSSESPVKMFKRPYSYNQLFNNPDNGCDGYLNTSYYFKYNTCLFVFLDCGDSNVSSTNEMFAKQANWLDSLLTKETNYEFVIVCMHKSLYGDPLQDSAIRKFAPTFTEVFDKHQVDLVISGHDHEYSRTKALTNGIVSDNGVVYLDLGNSGNKTRPIADSIKASDLYAKYIDIKAYNYSLGIVGLVENGSLLIEVRNSAYILVDSVSINKKNR